MLIDEFITYFEEQSKEHTNLVPYDVDEEYNRNCRQLVDLLRELKKYKEGIDQIKELIDDYKGWDNWDIVKGLQYALECLEASADE